MIEKLQPIFDLLGGRGGWVSAIIMWVAAVSAGLSPFAVWIRNKLADAILRAAESNDQDDDTYLRILFSNPKYRFAAFLLNFANVRLPTLAELDRALKHQQEAVQECEEYHAQKTAAALAQAATAKGAQPTGYQI